MIVMAFVCKSDTKAIMIMKNARIVAANRAAGGSQREIAGIVAAGEWRVEPIAKIARSVAADERRGQIFRCVRGSV